MSLDRFSLDPLHPSGVNFTGPGGLHLSVLGYWEFADQQKVSPFTIGTHRVVFYLTHGYMPEVVDHIDGNPSNNHPDNLRAATTMTNRWNSKTPTTNRSGIKGLHYDAKRKQWVAQVTAAGKLHKKTSNDKDFLVDWLTAKRAEVHKEFARVS